jgi:alkaline phosphatase
MLQRTTPVILTFLGLWGTAFITALANGAETDDPRSVILLIGDGFDDQHVTMGRNYLAGPDSRLLLDTMPVRGAVQVQTVDNEGRWTYVADSANTATTLATGVVTNIGRVGTGPADEDVKTILEMAAAAGYGTGAVSTSSITDATPASFIAHVSKRICEGPETILGGEKYGLPFEGCYEDARGNGGPGSIAEQIMASPVDVALGGGLIYFSERLPDGETSLLDIAKDHNALVIADPEQLTSPIPDDKRLIGLFAPEHLPVRWQGDSGRKAESPDPSWLNALDWRLGSVEQPAVMSCEPNPEYGNTPSLAALTRVAIERLTSTTSKGFFLIIESASIDKQSHERNPCGSIGEIAQLEEALQVSLNYAKQQENTMVLVTADHAQAAQIVPEPSLFDDIPVPVYSPGKVARIRLDDGTIMRINYATNNFESEEHTGANVPLFANEAARAYLNPYMRQQDIFESMKEFLDLKTPHDTDGL